MSLPEIWLRGPLPQIPALLQPVAHALLQASAEVTALVSGFDDTHLWMRPAGLASAGFHLQHLSGVLDRLFTYARKEALSEAQLAYLQQEGQCPAGPCSAAQLAAAFAQQVQTALVQLRHTPEASLIEYRGVGRAQLPSTLIGLYVHAAEHSMRHVGQLLVTAKLVQAGGPQEP